MDTKLKKTRKWAALIIALIVLLPSVSLVALYPRMEQVYVQEKEKLEEEGNYHATESWIEVRGDFVNYAVETTYYMYGQYLQEIQGKPVDFSVLDQYGWINDYYTMTADTDFFAVYESQNAPNAEGNSSYALDSLLIKDSNVMKENVIKQMQKDGYVGYLVIEYDTYGNISYIRFNDIALNSEGPVILYGNAYEQASQSIRQYENNVSVYNSVLPQEQGVVSDAGSSLVEHNYSSDAGSSLIEHNYSSDVVSEKPEEIETEETLEALEEVDYLPVEEVVPTSVDSQKSAVDPMELRPKNFTAVFAIDTNSEFIFSHIEDSASPMNIYWNMGVEWIIFVAAVFVAVMAIILPFVKRIKEGLEKSIRMPMEIVWGIAICAIAGFVFMFELMTYSSYTVLGEQIALYGDIQIVGTTITADTLYKALLAVNFLGWSLVFFLEYIVVASLRRFVCAPIRCIKEESLLFAFCQYLKKKVSHYFTEYSLGNSVRKFIIKIVAVNFFTLLLLCAWLSWGAVGQFWGVVGLLVYSVVLYLLLGKWGTKIQKQYRETVSITKQMADGNLKVELPEASGIFSELEFELQRVQDGFSKAVVEEAKSQNMKTELITNVSHDLKTPLTAIITYVDLLKKEDITEEECREYINTLDKKSQRLKVLIEDLFEVSKASSNNITMYYTDVDLVNLLKQVCLENEDKITESTLDIRWNLPDKKCMASLDPNRTYRIVDNLLQNALKYSMRGSRVYVDLEETEEEYVICFKNMSATEMNFDASEITERFVRGDLSRNTEGSGLGLAIARSFTELQNGKFVVEIDGDLFKVTLRFAKKE